jgi:hypothetical protein
MTTMATRTPASKAHLPEIVGSATLFLIFAGAFILALEWPLQASIFPLCVAGTGSILSAAYCLRASLRKPSLEVEPETAGLNLADNDEDSDDDIDHIFAVASRRDWLTSLGFLAGFFLALFLFGLYPTAAVFTALYLKYQAGSTWRFSLIYAAVLTACLYGIFSLGLQLPVPSGIFGS